MKSKKVLLRPAKPSPPALPGVAPLLMLVDVPKGLSRPDKTARRPTDTGYLVREPHRLSDRRPGVAATGAMARVRAHQPEFHKKAEGLAGPASAAPRARKVHGGLVARRRAGK